MSAIEIPYREFRVTRSEYKAAQAEHNRVLSEFCDAIKKAAKMKKTKKSGGGKRC